MRTTQRVMMYGRWVSADVPDAPPEEFKSYQILAPTPSHFRRVSCVEFGCLYYQFGWKSTLNESIEEGGRQAYAIRNARPRYQYREERNGPITTFWFEAGQQCFLGRNNDHQLRLERPEIYVVRDGDWRSSTNRRVHASAEDWVDDFRTHQDQIADLRQKG